MSDVSPRSTPVTGKDAPATPVAHPPAHPLDFPAVTSEGVTPLRVPAMSRAEASRLAAELEAKSAAHPSSTELRVRMVHPPVPEVDRVETGLRIAMMVGVAVVVGVLLWGVVTIGRGLESRMANVQVDDGS